MPSWREVFLYFLTLGFINIGGPVAQITMMYNHMVERRHWLSNDRFVRIMAFCHMLPGPEALQLAIYVGYLKKKLTGGILAGLTFILPGALIMIALSWMYVAYSGLPQVNNVLYVLKPAVLGIIAAGKAYLDLVEALAEYAVELREKLAAMPAKQRRGSKVQGPTALRFR